MKNTFAKMFTVYALAGVLGFALSACDDSSSAGGDETETSALSCSAEMSSSSRHCEDCKDEAISSDSKGGPSSAGTSTKSSDSNSSGNDTKSSSSAGKEVSSSSEEMKTAWDYLNPDIDYGEFTDERDGQVYKTVKIGDQVWMAQNLNYAYIDVPYNFSYYNNVYISDSTSWCYDNDPANCAKYGRLYTWAAAIDSVKLATDAVNPQDCGYGHLCSALNGIVKGICPSGWHLPQKSEWDTLFTAVSDGSTAVGNKFKSLSGWLSDRNGDDDFGFSALPAGLYGRGSFDSVGKMACFWSSVMYDIDTVYGVRLFSNNVVGRDEVGNYKYMGFSVRCVKDSD